jgi:general secretion pathway protein M
MKEWWFGLQASERRTLTVGGVALVLTLIYFVGWAPLQEGVATLETQVQEQQALKRWMEQSAAEVQQLRRGGAGQSLGAGRSLLTVVDQTARGGQLGPSLKRMEPEGDNGVKVWLEQVAFDEMMSWLVTLEQQYGVTVATLTVERQAVAGRVDAHMSLRNTAAQ